MIRLITASAPSFKDVSLDDGFNVVLAQPTEAATEASAHERKSTNGSGKTLLLEICQFCFGADASRTPLADDELATWTFTIEIEVDGRTIRVSRSIEQPGRVIVRGDFAGWPLEPRYDHDTSEHYFAVNDWTAVLGTIVYSLDLDSEESRFRPSFRTLFSYSIRRGLDAYGDAFRHFRGQSAWHTHVANAYFLGLDWRLYQRGELLRKREKKLKDARSSLDSALREGAMGESSGIGDLEARVINLERQVRSVEGQLSTFQVHPQYHEYEQQASDLTAQIHELIAESIHTRETVEFYEQTINEETVAEPADVDAVYDDAGLHFPEQVSRRLDDARRFHDRLVRNRQAYLQTELERLRTRIGRAENDVERLTRARAKVLSFLREHGALEEFTRLQVQHSEQIEELGKLRGRIEQLRSYEDNLAAIRIELEQLKLAARADLVERRDSWGRIVELFGEFTNELYEKPGQLVVDVADRGGLKLDVEIERGASQGVQEMVVFCYDLAVATALCERGVGPQLLFHDSTIFDGVDPRQKATALKLGERQSTTHGFQYLICLNEGDVPWDYLSEWNFRSFVRRELTDVGDGGLLGIRY